MIRILLCCRSSILYLLIIATLAGCQGSTDTNVQTPASLWLTPPTRDSSIRPDILADQFVEIKVNRGQVQKFVQSTSGDWILLLSEVQFNQNNTLDITWIVEVAGTKHVFATAVESFFADPLNPSIELDANYVTSPYDHDGDNQSNLEEMQAGSFPVSTPVMVELENPGSVILGSPPTELGCADSHCIDETQKQVLLKPFAISQHEISFDLYLEFTNSTGGSIPPDQGWGRGTRPVINVSFAEASAYASWLAAQTGKPYRLPTEAEWEYAARAGTRTAYHTGEFLSIDQANFNPLEEDPQGIFIGSTVPVDAYLPNAFGLYNMHGNVYEWTCSIYSARYNGAESACVADADGQQVTIRGGAWLYPANDARSANRHVVNVADGLVNRRRHYVGIRIVREL